MLVGWLDFPTLYSYPRITLTWHHAAPNMAASLPKECPMKRGWRNAVCLGILNLALVPGSSLLAAQKKLEKEAASIRLKVGDTAPDFTLLAFDGKELKKVSLQDYRGKKSVALAFFVFAFTGG
jgi:AhpC/TSA family